MAGIKNRLIYFIIFIVVELLTNCNNAVKDSPILLFTGKGTSTNDVKAIKHLLYTNHLDFAVINSSQLNWLDTNRLKKYKLMIIPVGIS